MGHVRAMVKVEELRSALLIEMIARQVKKEIEVLLRGQMKSSGLPGEVYQISQ